MGSQDGQDGGQGYHMGNVRRVTCGQCQFWKPVPEWGWNNEQGECRIHAPVIVPKNSELGWVQVMPRTSHKFWCGEGRFKRK